MKIHKKAGGDSKRVGGAAKGEKEDEELECRDCNSKFTFTVGEQEFFEQKGFDNKPVRGACVCARLGSALHSAAHRSLFCLLRGGGNEDTDIS